MKRIEWMALGWLTLSAASWVQAQGIPTRPDTGANSMPVISPYLNMARGGNAAVNYYGLVRPQLDARNAIQQLQQHEFAPAASSAPIGNGAPNTAHPVQFMNYSHYFSTNMGAGLNGRGSGNQNGSPGLRR
jgi:hypothetical protein